MTRRNRAPQRRRLSREDEGIQLAIDREHDRSRAYMTATGCSASVDHFPAIRRLLEAAQAAAEQGHKFSGGKGFTYCGRRFPVKLTSFGRVIVCHPVTGRDIGATSWFGAW